MLALAPKHISRWWIGICVLSNLVAGCSNRSEPQGKPVVILGAASTKDLLEEIAAVAQKSLEVPVEIELSTGPSHALAQQILSGAPADLYVSANRQWAAEIRDANRASQSVDWLTNSMVVVVPANSRLQITRLEDLTSDEVQRIAIAGKNVPAGIYAQQSLSYYRLWEPLGAAGKIIRGHDVRSALAYAQRGEVDAAIVYATDARLTDQVRVVFRLDPVSHAAIVYPLVKLRSDSNAANQVYQFFLGNEARQIAENFGFQRLEPGKAKE
ncbi:molybdate ABC transporter substrate-binding protein [Bremerella alba]|uniref:Molybdate-binding protein ModA n=1 Tax=Bremerella alba TaxID=980252 RepID=A0A7V9A7I4_9BACT|nr:molybdate ABC transporter substrate-binding protein [Bremerella alba]MBA2115382.1 Molybdate-binding protein ModA [Bremerella alba]